MSTRWGFDLDMSAVRLMRRENGQWIEIAIEKIDGPDIEDRLERLAGQVDAAEPVELFLPREQILYAEIDITSREAAEQEIDRAMDGRTPYSLDELEIDWELTGPGRVKVAAIAVETLDEARTFAEARGMEVGGFSSLSEPADFPRFPDFGGRANIFDPADGFETGASEDTAAPAPVTFQSARTPSRPPPGERPVSERPVLTVDDPTPVMQVRTRSLPPLNPGIPIDAPRATPRVRTDIASSAVSGPAASLTPSAARPIRIYSSPAPVRTLAIFAIALFFTVGIAAIVWVILPLAPGRSTIETPPGQPATEVGSTETAPAIEPEPETALLPPATPPLTELSTTLPPTAEVAPALAALTDAPRLSDLPGLSAAGPDVLPDHDPMPPLPPSPAALAGLAAQNPFPGPEPTEEVLESTDEIYIASVDRGSLAFDAIALPGRGGFSADALPRVEGPPGPSPLALLPDPAGQVRLVVPAELAPVAPGPSETSGPTATSDPDIVTEAPEALAALALPPLSPDAAAGPPADAAAPTVQAAPADTPSPQIEAQADAAAPEPATRALPAPTSFAAALTDRAPPPRPERFVDAIERQQFGGRTRSEMVSIRPPHRPESAQTLAVRTLAEPSSSELAVSTSQLPRARPRDFDAIVAQTVIRLEASRITASLDVEAPDTSGAVQSALEADGEPEAPENTPLTIPSSASVARQATIEDAIRLNKINLVGVYGVPSDRRALVRLASGRYIKVKVGDRVDGGTVAQITDSELIYQKGSRVYSLALPKG